MRYINGSELAEKRFIKLENGDLREVSTAHFIPAKGEIFFYLTEHGKIKNKWKKHLEETKWLLEHQPVFRTEKECVDYLKYVNSLDKYATKKVLSNPTKDHWYLVFDLNTNEIHTLYSVRTRYPHIVLTHMRIYNGLNLNLEIKLSSNTCLIAVINVDKEKNKMNSKTYYFHNICNINSADKLTPVARLELIRLCDQQETTDKIEPGTAVYLEEGVNVFIDNDGDVCILRCGANSIKKEDL